MSASLNGMFALVNQRLRGRWLFCLAVLLLLGRAWSVEPLVDRIDALVEEGWEGRKPAPPAGDGEFLRRAHLDLAGVIPSVEETRSFLASQVPDKRRQVVERLLDGPERPRQLARWFQVHFMERLGEDPVWQAWLEDSFARNKPWDQMAREILRADFRDEPNRGAAYFYAKRLENHGQNAIDYSGLTRDVGRLFLGVDLQCAECHNHRLIDDYKQEDFQGLLAGLGTLTLVRDAGYPAVEEKPMTARLRYASVFTQKERFVGPRVPGLEEVAPPELPKERQYLLEPDKKAKKPGVPRFSPLEVFATQIPKAPGFDANIVNRLWFMLMGRGLVEPLDQFHSENPATHPELLRLLATEFAARGRDMHWLIGELMRTEAYQRSSRLPEGAQESECPPHLYLTALERRLSAEQLHASTLRAATGHAAPAILASSSAQEGESLDKARAAVSLKERFRKAMANDPRQPEHEFAPSLKSALFMMNDPEVLRLLEGEGSLVSRLGTLEDPALVAEELCLAIWSRLPTEVEQAEIQERLKGERRESLKELAWAMLTSTEFVVNH